MNNVTVIGAGVTGLTTAYYLCKQGFSVTVIDQFEYVAGGTSHSNGCQLSASNAEVWNNWRNVFKGITWLMKQDAPLLINPKPTWHKYSWLVQFLLNIRHRQQNTIETCEMALNSHVLLKQILADEGISDQDINKLDRGILHFYREQKEIDHARSVNHLYSVAGLKRQEVTVSEIVDIEPALKNTAGNMVGGFYTDADFTADIRLFCIKLSEVLKQKYHVTFVEKTVTNRNIFEFKNSDPVVVCAGTGSRDICEKLGFKLPIYPVKGYSITVDLQHSTGDTPTVSTLDDQKKIVCSRLGDTLRVAGTAEFNGYNRDIRQARIQPLQNWVDDTFPQIQQQRVRTWAGLRPMTPNMMPIVGPSGVKNVWLNTGHGHLGWTLSCFTANQIATQISQSIS